MIAMTEATAFLIMWITFTAIALVGVVAVLVWAVRSRQFSDQDHARRLPLDSGIPTDAPADSESPKPPDRTSNGGEGTSHVSP